MRRTSNWILAAAVLALTACTPQPGPSAATATITPDPVPIPAYVVPPTTTPFDHTWFRRKEDAATVSWSGMAPDGELRIMVCARDDADPAFVDPAQSCSYTSEYLLTSSASGQKRIALFRGENPDEDSGWGCYAEGDVAPPGVDRRTTCYVRIVSGDSFHPVRSVSVPFTIVDEPVTPDPVVPDLPRAPALAVGGALAAVGLVLWSRRRALG